MRNVVLLSGGIDSTVAFALACFRDGPAETTALGISYGQAHINELAFGKQFALRHGATYVQCVIDPSPWKQLPLMTGKTNQDRWVHAMRTGGISDAFLPGRNVAFLGAALAVAGVNGANTIWMGSNKDDWEGFPDCRPPFIHCWEQMASHALARGMHLYAPLVHMTKREIVLLGQSMALDFTQTWSCYRPLHRVTGAIPCGRCDACRLREDALRGPLPTCPWCGEPREEIYRYCGRKACEEKDRAAWAAGAP